MNEDGAATVARGPWLAGSTRGARHRGHCVRLGQDGQHPPDDAKEQRQMPVAPRELQVRRSFLTLLKCQRGLERSGIPHGLKPPGFCTARLFPMREGGSHRPGAHTPLTRGWHLPDSSAAATHAEQEGRGSAVQLGSKERAQLIGLIAKAGEERAGREVVNKEPLCTGGPGTRPRLQPAARAKQTGTVWSEGGQADGRTETRPPLGESRSQGLSWELGAAQRLPSPRVENSPRWPRPSIHRGGMEPCLIHPRGRGQRGGWQSAGDAPGQKMSDSPSATAIFRTGNF